MDPDQGDKDPGPVFPMRIPDPDPCQTINLLINHTTDQLIDHQLTLHHQPMFGHHHPYLNRRAGIHPMN